jgi:hypothetical protein
MQDTYSNLTGDQYTQIGTGLFTGATNLIGSKNQLKGQEAQANALIKQGLSQVEIAKLQLQSEQTKLEALKAGGGTTSNSKTLYIILGVGGVLVLGGIIFAVTRK